MQRQLNNNNVTVVLLDLNSEVHARCGANYTNCSLCDNETQCVVTATYHRGCYYYYYY